MIDAGNGVSGSRAQRRRIRKAYHTTLVIVMLVLCALLISENQRAERAKAELIAARTALAREIQYGASQIVVLSRKIVKPGAAVEKKLLPQFQTEFNTLIALNDCARNAYGAAYTPIDAQALSKIASALAAVQERFNTGRTLGDTLETLERYACVLETVLKTRFTESGDIVPSE